MKERSYTHQKPLFGALTLAIVFAGVICSWLVYPINSYAMAVEKSPADVYQQVLKLADAVKHLRKKQKIKTPWPQVRVETGRAPRHAFQKAIEILNKINHYRVHVLRTGEITVPRFPGREISPNEVFSVVVRLHRELELVVGERLTETYSESSWDIGSITPNHVYAALFEISIALEETLGLRSISPSQVYTRSQQVKELALFLRRSQGLALDVPKPERTEGKLPNHALAAVHRLLAKIREAEKNLWMKPLEVPTLDRKVIKPSDVYDAMGVVLAELQRIQFRLGLEREFPAPKPETGKRPDDVIQNTLWAAAILPAFELGKPLLQYDRQALLKTPSHVYSVTQHILQGLTHYRHIRGIRVPPRQSETIPGLKPQHVYSKVLENMEKVDLLRHQQNMGGMAVPEYPLRHITASEVFDLTLRLDHELSLVYRHEGIAAELWGVEQAPQEFTGKTPSDVFANMQRIAHLLDTLLGSEGYTPNDVYREAMMVQQEVKLVAQSLGERIPERTWLDSQYMADAEPRDVLIKAHEVLDLVGQVKRRAGIFGSRNVGVSIHQSVTPSDVYNQVRLIDAELNELKVFLAIDGRPNRIEAVEGKRPAHVLQVLEGLSAVLKTLLHQGGKGQ